MDNGLIAEFKAFMGINNVDPLYRLPVKREDPLSSEKIMDVSALENMDIDNTRSLKTRPGKVLKFSGSDIHSGWSDGTTCLFVDGSSLCSMDSDYQVTVLKADLTVGMRMVYEPYNDRIYLTNGSYIGYYKDGSLYGLANPGMTFKVPLPAGQRLCVFNNRLMVASRNTVYVADGLSDHYDVRTGFLAMVADVTMLRAVDNGFYVSDDKTWFVNESFARILAIDKGAIPFTDISIDGHEVKGSPSGKCVMWMSPEGICIGDNLGKVVSITSERYALPADYVCGGAFLRSINGVNHYIVTLG